MGLHERRMLCAAFALTAAAGAEAERRGYLPPRSPVQPERRRGGGAFGVSVERAGWCVGEYFPPLQPAGV